MKFWLIIFLFTPEGEFHAKEVQEAANEQQCVSFAQEYTPQLINKQMQAQFYCVSDDHYMGRQQDPGIPYD